MEEQMKYYAFISYNSADEKWAKWLQHNLEYYHVPSALCKEYPDLPKKIRPVFWYKQDLSGTKLKEALSKELESSKYLIVVCSPESAKSVWVNDEVLSFLEQGKGDKIIPFIVGGTPHAKNPNEECFPPALLGLKRDEEIRGIDVRRKEGKWHALVDVIATMFGIRFDELWERHKKRRRRIVFLSILSLLAVLAVCVAWRVSVKKELITQAKFIAAEAKKLAENGDVYNATRLMTYIYKNNKKYIYDKNCWGEIISTASLINESVPILLLKKDKGLLKAIFNENGGNVIAYSDSLVEVWSVKKKNCIWSNTYNKIQSVDFSPRGNYLLIKSKDKKELYSIEEDTCLFYKNISEYKNLKFSPDEKSFLVYSDKEVGVWSLGKNNFVWLQEIDNNFNPIFGFNGKYVYAYSDTIVKIWSVEKKNCITQINNNVIKSVGLSHKGNYLLILSEDKKELYSVEDNRCLPYKDFSEYKDLKFSPDEKSLVMYSDTEIMLWSLEKNKSIWSKKIDKSYYYVEFSSNNDYILLRQFRKNGRLFVYSVIDGNIVFDIPNINIAHFSTSGKYLITNGMTNNGTYYTAVWSMDKQDKVYTRSFDYEGHQLPIISPDDKYIIVFGNTYSDSNCCFLSEIEDEKKLKYGHNRVESPYPKAKIKLAKITPDNKFLYVVFEPTYLNNKIRIYSFDEWKWLDNEIDGFNNVKKIGFDVNGENMIIVDDHEVELWSMKDKKRIDTLDYGSIKSTVFSNDGKYLLTTKSDTAKLWLVEEGNCIDTLHHNGTVNSAIFSHNGKYILTASNDSTVKLWSVENGQLEKIYRHDNPVDTAIFSLNDKYITTVSGGKNSISWTAKGKCLRNVKSEKDVKCISFDNTRHVVSSYDDSHDYWYIRGNDLRKGNSKFSQFTPDGNYWIRITRNDNLHYYLYAAKLYGNKWKMATANYQVFMNDLLDISYNNDGIYAVQRVDFRGNDIKDLLIINIRFTESILDKWSEMLGPNAELTKEEKARYFLN